MRGERGEEIPEEMETVLRERRARWRPKEARYQTGALGLFTRNAASPVEGAYCDGEQENR